jgi:HlyD family secretion protein
VKPPPSLNSLSRAIPLPAAGRRIPAWFVPAAIAAGFALLFAALFRDRLIPAPKFEVAMVLATAADSAATPTATQSDEAPGGLLFQASGWIEPDPLPIRATALVDGVIDTVLVLEGQTVAKGVTLAVLVADDARLSLATAEQNHQSLVSMRDAHLGSIVSARLKLEGAQAQAKAATSLRDEAADQLARLKALPGGAISELEVVSARWRVEREEFQQLAAASAGAEAEAEVARLELETQVRETQIRAAAIDVEKARLALSRTTIVSPMDGRVLRLMAAPGQKKMLLDNDPESSTVAILYDPTSLQVRVDVPLADAAGLRVGQAARIRCGLLPDEVFDGTVTRITGEADLQRNTLQAKVAITAPSDQLRPEMLCRVEFLGHASPATASSPRNGPLAVWVPAAAVNDDSAWVCDPETQRVTKRAVQLGSERREGFLRVDEGLRPGERVLLSPANLRENQRVNPTQVEP